MLTCGVVVLKLKEEYSSPFVVFTKRDILLAVKVFACCEKDSFGEIVDCSAVTLDTLKVRAVVLGNNPEIAVMLLTSYVDDVVEFISDAVCVVESEVMNSEVLLLETSPEGVVGLVS